MNRRSKASNSVRAGMVSIFASGVLLVQMTIPTASPSGTNADLASGAIVQPSTTASPAPVHHLDFGVQPIGTMAGHTISSAVTVRIDDASGNLVTGDSSTVVSLSIGNNPGGGFLSGGSSITASGGIATFSTLSIDRAGAGYTLNATGTPVLAGATSGRFDIAQPPTHCTFCVLSDTPGYYALNLDQGADLRVDGDIMVNQDTWYTGTVAVNRCGATPCTPATCSDWSGLPGDHRVLMCGTGLVVDHTSGVDSTTLSAHTISINGGWQTRLNTDIVHADQLAAACPYHPNYLGYVLPANVCIGVPKIADPLNDPANPQNNIPAPDPTSLIVPVDGTNGCIAVPGTTLVVPTGTLANPARLFIHGTQGTFTICPGLYFGGFAVNGDAASQPKVVMLPGTYFMVGGGFSVTGSASIDGSAGVMIYNTGGAESFSSNSTPGDGLVPRCDAAASTCVAPVISGGLNGLTNSPANVAVNSTVTYTMRLQNNPLSPRPTGTVTFYDGNDPIACTPVVGSDATHVTVSCSTSYSLFGTRGITAVYSGDPVYAPIGDTVNETINPPAGAVSGNVDIDTATSPCGIPPCGRVLLRAPISGQYSGMLIFQDRTDGLGVRIDPAAGAPACTGNWMTDGVPPDANHIPEPCGPLGGLSGTIYAPHVAHGSPADFDAIVNIGGSGVANLQVIAAQINLTAANTQARFTFGSDDTGDHRRATSTVVVCSPASLVLGGAATCNAIVTDIQPGGAASDPDGSAIFTVTTGPGSLAPAFCNLVSDGNPLTFTSNCSTTYTPSAVGTGTHTVGASFGGSSGHFASTDADGDSIAVAPAGPLDHLALNPATASISANGSQAYTADGRDAFDNSLGLQTGVTYTISPNGSCGATGCTARLAGVHTVTGTKSGKTGSASLTVNPGPLDHLVLSPLTASVTAGIAQAYTAEGRDAYNNSLGDMTAGTVFTIAPNGGCDGASCAATVPGNHTVTGTNAGRIGRATLGVGAGPLDHLALAPASASIAFGAGQTYSATGRDAFNNPLGTLSGVVYTISLDGSCSNNVCTPASVGLHSVTGTKSGRTGTASLAVTKANPTLTYTGTTAAVHGATITLSATLKRAGGVAIAGATISFTVNGQVVTAVTNASGVASTTSTAPTTPATYAIAVAFAGDASYNAASVSKNLVVKP